MEKTFSIPEQYYKYGEPVRCDYNKGDNNGLCYKNGGEEAFEMAAAFGGTSDQQYSVIALTSPYVIGFKNMGKNAKLISVDIKNKKVIVDLEN